LYGNQTHNFVGDNTDVELAQGIDLLIIFVPYFQSYLNQICKQFRFFGEGGEDIKAIQLFLGFS
jgi:hypothetical protein